MLATIADKQSLVRGDAIACMDKWAEHVGPEVIINNLTVQIALDNPESRTESLKWILKQKDSIKIPQGNQDFMVVDYENLMGSQILTCLSSGSLALVDAEIYRLMASVCWKDKCSR